MSTRIKTTDALIDIAVKMSEGNPGALTFSIGILESGPDNIKYFLVLDELGLYGSAMYQLWNDCCQRDIEKVFKVLDKYSKGEFTKEFILDYVDQPYGKNIVIEECGNITDEEIDTFGRFTDASKKAMRTVRSRKK